MADEKGKSRTTRAVANKELIDSIDNGQVSLDTMMLNIKQAEKYSLISENTIAKARELHNDEWFKQQEDYIRKTYADKEAAEIAIANLRKNREKDIVDFARKMEDNLYAHSSKAQKIKMQTDRQQTALAYKEELRLERMKIASSNMNGNSKNAKLKELRKLELQAGRDAVEAEKRKRALTIANIQEKRKDGTTTRQEIDAQMDAINESFEAEREQHANNIESLNEQIALLEEKKKKNKLKDGGTVDKEIQSLKQEKAKEQQSITDSKKQQLKDGTLANVMKGVTHALNEGLKALSDSLNKAVDEAITTVGQYKSVIDARLQGASAFSDLVGPYEMIALQLKASLAASPFVKQKEVIQKITEAIDKGIAYNVEQRAFLQTVSDKIVKTFDAFDSNLMRLIRLQQADTTSARMGMEARLLQFFNSTFSDNSYLTEGYDQVSQALVDANAQMTRDMSISFEFNVQKWLGSLASLGFGTDTIQTIAQGINYLGSGNVAALAGNTQLQNLLAMSAVRAGLPYSDLLVKGIDDSSVNKLLKAMVEYLAEIAKDNNAVVKAAYGDVFNFTQADLRAVKNLTSSDIGNIYNQSMTYSQGVRETQSQLYRIATRLSMTEMIDNVVDNFLYTAGESIGSNMGKALTWRLLNIIEGATGGIHFPNVGVMGNFIDLSTFTVEGLAKTAMFGLSALGNIPTMITSILSGGGLSLGIWGFDEYTKRGGNFESTVGGVQSTVSGSRTMASSSSSDTKKQAISETEEDQKNAKESAESMMDGEITLETLYNTMFKDHESIYTINKPIENKISTIVTTVNDINSKIENLYHIVNGYKNDVMSVKVNNISDFKLNDLKPVKTIGLDGNTIRALAQSIATKLMGGENRDEPDGIATLSDIADLLRYGTLNVNDPTMAQAFNDMKKDLIY